MKSMIPSPYDIIAFEFAMTTEQANIILNDWATSGRIQLEIISALLDYGYMVVYGLLLAGLTLLLTRKIEGRFHQVGLWFVTIPIIAAIFDAIENVNLLIMLLSPTAYIAFNPLLASLCAGIKFALIIISIIWVLITAVVAGYQNYLKK
jgi:hypothetical protein